MRYKLTATDPMDRSIYTAEFTTDTLTEVLAQFDQFLRACGFIPPQTKLRYADDEPAREEGPSL